MVPVPLDMPRVRVGMGAERSRTAGMPCSTHGRFFSPWWFLFWFLPFGLLYLIPLGAPSQTVGSVHPLQTSFSFQGHHSLSCLHKNPMMVFCPSPPRLGWDNLKVPPAQISPVVPPCYTTDTKVPHKAAALPAKPHPPTAGIIPLLREV